MTTPTSSSELRGCTRCGMVVRSAKTVAAKEVMRCPECHARIGDSGTAHGDLVRQRTAALTIAALVLYPAAVLLPILQVQRLGRTHEAGVLDGAADLLSEGYIVLGLVVVVCSVVIPISKLLGLLLLCTSRVPVSARHRGRAWWFIELSGRWGMLDVLLVAALVAFVKLGDVIDIQPGPGAVLFAMVVGLSLLAAMVFDPRAIRVRVKGMTS